MPFFGLPTELRLRIYSELLVDPKPIAFAGAYHDSDESLRQINISNLHPALLRTCRKVYDEASPLLYSHNAFQFRAVLALAPAHPYGPARISSFLRQIGSRKTLTRHFSIVFPAIAHLRCTSLKLHEDHIKNLELIRDVCTKVVTVELLIQDPRDYIHSLFAAEAMDLLSVSLKHISLPAKTIICVVLYQLEASESQITDTHAMRWQQERNEIVANLVKKMRDRGWPVRIKERVQKGR
jgi:hypothetical protein